MPSVRRIAFEADDDAPGPTAMQRSHGLAVGAAAASIATAGTVLARPLDPVTEEIVGDLSCMAHDAALSVSQHSADYAPELQLPHTHVGTYGEPISASFSCVTVYTTGAYYYRQGRMDS